MISLSNRLDTIQLFPGADLNYPQAEVLCCPYVDIYIYIVL